MSSHWSLSYPQSCPNPPWHSQVWTTPSLVHHPVHSTCLITVPTSPLLNGLQPPPVSVSCFPPQPVPADGKPGMRAKLPPPWVGWFFKAARTTKGSNLSGKYQLSRKANANNFSADCSFHDCHTIVLLIPTAGCCSFLLGICNWKWC